MSKDDPLMSNEQNNTKSKLDFEKNQASTKRCYEVTLADLPLSCPPLNLRVWDSHPRVYLPILETGKVECPYCGAEYVLLDDSL